MMSFSRGSEWRKWDLHIHTPASFFWNDGIKLSDMNDSQKKEAIEKFIKTVNESDIAVFCIMDYWTFDWYIELLKYIKSTPKENEEKIELKKTVFPGMELRIESPTSYRLNIHVILSDKLSEQTLIDFKSELLIRSINKKLSNEAIIQFAKTLDESKAKIHGYSNPVGLDDKNLLELGSKTVEITKESLQNALNTIPKNCGYILMPYDTSDGLLKLDWKKHPHDDNYYMQSSHIFESRDQVNIDLFNGVKTQDNKDFFDNFQKTLGNKPKPCVSGSDAHRFTEYGKFPSNKITWIKANPTFEGLKQVINEPKDRVFIGELPPKLNLVHTNKDKYIEKIIIEKIPDSTEVDTWFNNMIELNSDLVAIIGNKGNGKSALADIIALSGHAKLIDHSDYSFLNKERFRKHNNLANSFQSTLIWKNGTNILVNLNDQVKETDIEKIKYLPQKYIEKICSSDEYTSFQQEINKVVFSHIKEENKLGKTNLKDLIKEKTQYITDKRTEFINQIKNLIQEHIDLTSKYSKTELSKKENLLKEKEQQIADHQKIKAEITVVENPSNDSGLQAQHKEKVAQTEHFSTSINELKKTIDVNQNTLNNLKISKNGLVKIENDLKLEKERFDNNQINLRNQIEQYKLDLDITRLIEFKINTQLIENAKESIEKSIAALVLKQGQDEIQLELFLYEQAKLSSELSEPERAYQTYLEQINLWNQKNQELENEKNMIDYELNFAKNELPVRLIGIYRKYIKQYKKLFQTYQEELNIYQEQYKPILDFVATEKDKIKSKKGFINFTAYIAIDKKKLYSSLLFYFDGRRQTFYNDELLDVINSLEDCHELSLMQLRKKIIRLIKSKGKNPQQQFRDGMELLKFYSSLSDLDYLNIEYDIMLDDKKVNQLSPGERGALLIIFYLLIDKGDIPLVIDQPEDNLDNESVFEYLVPYIKKAKDRRQIIIVTHNPNIAVVADAEQIIYSEIDKTQGNTVTYLSGAIEDEIINNKIVKVLEGTMPAFDNRTIKYYRV